MKSLTYFCKSAVFTYLVVGGLTAIIYFGLIALCIEFIHLDYRIGVSVAYVFAVSFHFLANRKHTFRATDSGVLHQMVRYMALLVVNYLITLLVVYGCVAWLGASTYIAAALSILITVSTGYCVSKFWVFRSRKGLLNV